RKQNLIVWGVLLAAAVALGAWWQSGREQAELQEQEAQETTASGQSQDVVIEEVPNALEGELLVSTDRRRGNLMLLLEDSDRIIYLNTSRDFSQLVGKQVSVIIEGSLDDFRLIDIQEK